MVCPEPPAWSHLVNLHKPGRPIKVALPCVGIDGCTRALQLLGVEFKAVNVYDVEARYRNLLQQHFAEACPAEACPTLHLGRKAGDVLQLDLGDLEAADGLVAGPPCPPWAGTGKRGGQADPRALVFEKVLDMMLSRWSGSPSR